MFGALTSMLSGGQQSQEQNPVAQLAGTIAGTLGMSLASDGIMDMGKVMGGAGNLGEMSPVAGMAAGIAQNIGGAALGG